MTCYKNENFTFYVTNRGLQRPKQTLVSQNEERKPENYIDAHDESTHFLLTKLNDIGDMQLSYLLCMQPYRMIQNSQTLKLLNS